MIDYQSLYHLMFNAITDALQEQERENYEEASEILKIAQLRAEEAYIQSSDENSSALST